MFHSENLGDDRLTYVADRLSSDWRQLGTLLGLRYRLVFLLHLIQGIIICRNVYIGVGYGIPIQSVQVPIASAERTHASNVVCDLIYLFIYLKKLNSAFIRVKPAKRRDLSCGAALILRC